MLTESHRWLSSPPGLKRRECLSPPPSHGFKRREVQQRVRGSLGAMHSFIRLCPKRLDLANPQPRFELAVQHFDLPPVQICLNERAGIGDQISGQEIARLVVASPFSSDDDIGSWKNNEKPHRAAFGPTLPQDIAHLLVLHRSSLCAWGLSRSCHEREDPVRG